MGRMMIVGARGFIGSSLSIKAQDMGWDVVRISSSDGSGLDPRSGEIPDGFNIPTGVSTVIYMAQSPYFREVPEHIDHLMMVNTYSAIKLANLSRKAGASRFLYLSTGNVYEPSFEASNEASRLNFVNWYALSKIHAEQSLRLLGSAEMRVIIARLFGVYGPNQTGRLVPNLIQTISEGSPVVLQAKEKGEKDPKGLRICLSYLDDIVSALMELCVFDASVTLNIASSEVVSIKEIALAIGNIIKRDPFFEVSTTCRATDLVADSSLFSSKFGTRFRPFSKGIEDTINIGSRS